MTDYTKEQHYQENQILEHAAEILAHRYVRGDALTNPDATKEYIRCKLGAYEREVFATPPAAIGASSTLPILPTSEITTPSLNEA